MPAAVTSKIGLDSYPKTQIANKTNTQNSTQNLIFPEQTNTQDPKEITTEKTAENIPKEKENGSFWTKVKTKVKNLFKKSKENVVALKNKNEPPEILNAVPEEVCLVDGKPVNGLYKGVLYENGLKFNGLYEGYLSTTGKRYIYQEGLTAEAIAEKNIPKIISAVAEQINTQEEVDKFKKTATKEISKYPDGSPKAIYTKNLKLTLSDGYNKTKDLEIKLVTEGPEESKEKQTKSYKKWIINFEGTSKTNNNKNGVQAREEFKYDGATKQWEYKRHIYKARNGNYVLTNTISTKSKNPQAKKPLK